MYSNYRLFGSGYLPLLAFDDDMIKDLSSSSQSCERGLKTQLSRGAILKAWNANKRHLRSMSNPNILSNYGIRKEVTLRFDIILAARFVLPLDHLFFQAGTGLSEQRAQSDVAQCFVGEKMLSYDQWIWLARWTVTNKSSRHREELIERQGLGLENVVKTSGMLWIPPNKMDWQRGYLALDDAEELLERAFSLATEEIARAYHQHVLLKLQSYWERDRARIGHDKLPPLSRLQECIEDSATENGQIVTAQTIWEVYAEGWSLYAEVCADADPNKLPQGLPYWMTTRTQNTEVVTYKHDKSWYQGKPVFFKIQF
ncbi:hypothetical protein NOF04DRAFT_1281893 [Fusarium oxysporum II5]|nr:hypothetical protein NOF04DRAFT_1281893 [Fusarium oxysporum II5]